ncbi:MAG: DUF5906 domain-containing protein [Bacteroidaceae bacterium]|nr:DUF5906 domain-containing protein [Bacteroidaceae bacterium]
MAENTMNATTGSLQEQIEMLEECLFENYEVRYNELSDKFEIREREEGKDFRPITREVFNKLCHRIKKKGLEIPSLKQNLEEIIYSEDTETYSPIGDYLNNLPEWDGHNYIADLFGCIPGITSELEHLCSIWFLSAVAHWLKMDTLHGNEVVIALIGQQGCGKSTFCAKILPFHLRSYYLDHINLGNKNDKEMALTNNLLVNLDELDQIKPGQHAELKQTLSKSTVNGRPIYGRSQRIRHRYASFVGTTNNPRPLSDPTGSRRYLCIQIPDGEEIKNKVEINYEQLYAQAVYELRVKNERYWFTNEEVKRIQELNADFQKIADLSTMIDCCLRHPEEGELVTPMNTKQIADVLKRNYPDIQNTAGFNIKLGVTLKKMEFQRRCMAKGQEYFIVPRKAA